MTTFLKHIRIENFGSSSEKSVGPFTAGLNLVYGKNESGKTTISEFIGGVLFGWQSKRGTNTYKPKNAERSGSLFFEVQNESSERSSNSQSEIILSRTKELTTEPSGINLVSDLDESTFDTVFSLTSDELNDLDNHNEVTEKLLTAGSGTGSSPSDVLAEITDTTKEYRSQAAKVSEHSLVQIQLKIDELRAQIEDASELAQHHQDEDAELEQSKKEQAQLDMKIQACLDDIEDLKGKYKDLEHIEDSISEKQRKLDNHISTIKDYENELSEKQKFEPSALLCASEDKFRESGNKLNELNREQEKQADRLAGAENDYRDACAESAAAKKASFSRQQEQKRSEKKRREIIVCAALALVFLLAGVPLVLNGASAQSFMLSALGGALVLFAILVGVGAVVLLIQSHNNDDNSHTQEEDYEKSVLKYEDLYDQAQQDKKDIDKLVENSLVEMGLESAQGSIERAKMLLETARKRREDINRLEHDLALERQGKTDLEKELADLKKRREEILPDSAYEGSDFGQTLQSRINALNLRHRNLEEEKDIKARRVGELTERLSQARGEKQLDELRLELEMLQTQKQETGRDYVRHLLAKRMLEDTIKAWDRDSQPEIYRIASELLSDMTEGAWVKVETDGKGKIVVRSAVQVRREPRHLSLGTRQQLYLALRIALLMSAKDVGKAIPILADDILVNFDSNRRLGAARALAKLAETRQVIMFTCHEEVVNAMEEACPTLHRINL